MQKTKLLACTEATYLSSGYARYYNALLRYLHNTGEFDICELAAWGDVSNPQDNRWRSVPWKFIPVLPTRGNEQEKREYESNPQNKFGAWRFETACVQHQPDIVLGLRDIWHEQFAINSPLRKYYRHILSPAIDAIPQQYQWLSWYKSADAVVTYTDWAKNVIEEVSSNQIKTVGAISPVCEPCYRPITDKITHKQRFGFHPTSKIIGTVMRNQRRKLFPKLFEAFSKYIYKYNLTDTYLYCHTSYPDDNGFDFPTLLKEYNIGHRVIFTYVCRRCGNIFPSFFRDAKTWCHKCNSPDAGMTNTYVGIADEVMSDIYNTFDIYVQCASLEGLGMPQVEAAACGVPVMAVDYSAMSEVVRKVNGFPIKVGYQNVEMESGRIWSYPDVDHMVFLWENFFALDSQSRNELSLAAREGFEQHYRSWDWVGERWYNILKNIEKPNHSWVGPPQLFQPSKSPPPNSCSNSDFARWLITDVLGEPHRLDSYFELRLVRDLNAGAINTVGGLYDNECSVYEQVNTQPFGRKEAYESIVNICNYRNYWERVRSENCI